MLRVIWLRLSGCCRRHYDGWYLSFCVLCGECAVQDVWVIWSEEGRDGCNGVHAAALYNAEKLKARSVNALHCSSHFEWIRRFFQTADVRSPQKKRPRVQIVRKMVRWYAGWWGRSAGWSLSTKSAVFLGRFGLVWAGAQGMVDVLRSVRMSRETI